MNHPVCPGTYFSWQTWVSLQSRCPQWIRCENSFFLPMLSLQRVAGNLSHPHPIRGLLSLKLIRNNLLAVKPSDKKLPWWKEARKRGQRWECGVGFGTQRNLVNSSIHTLFPVTLKTRASWSERINCEGGRSWVFFLIFKWIHSYYINQSWLKVQEFRWNVGELFPTIWLLNSSFYSRSSTNVPEILLKILLYLARP